MRTTENVGALQKETGDLVTWNVEKAEVFNDILPQSSPASVLAILPKSQYEKAVTRRMN